MAVITREYVKTAPALVLKPNRYFNQVDIPWLYEKRGIMMMLLSDSMVLGDDVGLGKTLQAIIAFSYLKHVHPDMRAVVFTEKATLFQWQKEIAWLCPNMRVDVVTAVTHKDMKERKEALLADRDMLITTYSTLYGCLDELMRGLGPKFEIIADECVYFKNHEAILFRQIQRLRGAAARAYGMTATIIENRLEEAYSIFRVVAPGTFPSLCYFNKTFCVFRDIERDAGSRGRIKTRIVSGYKNLHQFRRIIEPVFFGRLQTDPEVQQHLPEDLHKDMEVQMTVEQSRKVLEAMRGLIELPDGEVKALGVLNGMTMCQQMVDMPSVKGFDLPSEKLEDLIEVLQGSLAGEHVIVWSKFREVIDAIERALTKVGIKTVRITGKEDEYQREAAKVAFNDGLVPVLLMTKAGQRGLNLQKAGHFFFFDLPWSWGIYRQLVGRMKRTGSLYERVGVYRMLARLHPAVLRPGEPAETIDHYTLKVVQRKKILADAVQGDTTTIEDIDPSAVMEIFQSIRDSRRLLVAA